MKIGYYIKEAIHGIRHNLKMTISSISAISICLLLLGAAYMLYTTLSTAITAESQKTEYIAYVEDTYSEQQAYELQSAVGAVENVDKVEFVSRDTAKIEFAEFLDSGALADLPSDIFRHRFIITMKDNSKSESTILELQIIKGIAEVSGDATIINGYETLNLGLHLVFAAIIVMFVVISLVVISNALTASFERRKKEIGIMRLCGVSEGHIRRPLSLEGFFIGIVSSGIAFILLWGFYHALYMLLTEAGIAQLLGMQRFLIFGFDLAAVYAAMGIILGFLAGRIAGMKGRRRRSKKGGVFQP